MDRRKPMTNVVQPALRPWWRRYLRHMSIVLLVAIGAGLSYQEPAPVVQFREAVWGRYVSLKPRPFDPSLGVRIIAIDDRSLAAYGHGPGRVPAWPVWSTRSTKPALASLHST